MAIQFRVELTAAGSLNQARIDAVLKQAQVQAKIRALREHPHQIIEASYPLGSRYNQEVTLGREIDTQLSNLGVGLMWVEDVAGPAVQTEEIKISYGQGIATAIRRVNRVSTVMSALPLALRPKAVLHVLQTLAFPGVPFDAAQEIGEHSFAQTVTLPTGAAAALGICATGNLGAISRLMRACREHMAAPTENVDAVLAKHLNAQECAAVKDIAKNKKVDLDLLLRQTAGVLNGGHGTRLFGLRKLKGDVLYGQKVIRNENGQLVYHKRNLTIWNIWTAIYFAMQMPRSTPHGHYNVNLANDGILVPFGALTAQGTLLSEITAAEAKEGYFFVSPDNDKIVSEKETKRFGMVALRCDGTFICATEKKGRAATIDQAKKLLGARGEQVRDDNEIRLYINYFGMATTPKVEQALEEALQSVIRPGLTIDECGDLDTYSLLFAAITCQTPEEFRKVTAGQGLHKIFIEGATDNILFARLRRALFSQGTFQEADLAQFGNVQELRTALEAAGLAAFDTAPDGTVTAVVCPKVNEQDAQAALRKWIVLSPEREKALFAFLIKNKPQLRFGFAEFNRNCITLDIGTLDAYYGYFSALTRSFQPAGESRDKLFQYLRTLEEGGTLSPAQLTDISDLEAVAANNERMTRQFANEIAGFDHHKTVEANVFETDPSNPIIIGVNTDRYAEILGLKGQVSDSDLYQRLLSRVASRDNNLNLVEKREGDRPDGKLLYLYDPEGIKEVKLVGNRIRAGTIIGRNVVAIGSELGGDKTTIIAENGAIVSSVVRESIIHDPTPRPDQLALDKGCERLAKGEIEEFVMPMRDGWRAVIKRKGTERSQGVAEQLFTATTSAQQKERRNISALAGLEQQLGLINDEGTIRFDLKKKVSTYVPIDETKPSTYGNTRQTAYDPTDAHSFSVHFERTARAQYVVYGRTMSSVTELTGKKTVARSAVEEIYGDKDTSWQAIFVDPKADQLEFKPLAESGLRSIRDEKKQRPMLGLYEQIPGQAFVARMPTGGAAMMEYDVAFDANPAKDKLGIYGGITMKDPRMQEQFGYYTQFRIRTPDELALMAKDIATQVNEVMRHLPAINSMPLDVSRQMVQMDTLINKNEMEKAIKNGIGRGESLRGNRGIIARELRRQSTRILAIYIATALNTQPDEISEILENFASGVTRRTRRPIEDLFTALGHLNGTEQKSVREIIKGFPYSESFIRREDIGVTSEFFSYALDALVEQFRMVEDPLVAPIAFEEFNPATDFALTPADEAIMPQGTFVAMPPRPAPRA
ncbi:MAG: hypothetical protein ABIE84_06325 [bacterium]